MARRTHVAHVKVTDAAGRQRTVITIDTAELTHDLEPDPTTVPPAVREALAEWLGIIHETTDDPGPYRGEHGGTAMLEQSYEPEAPTVRRSMGFNA